MSPKSAKDAGDAWRKLIEEAILDEETWTLKVIMLESAGSEQDGFYLHKFETFAANEKRFVIKCIDKSETIFMVNQLGAEKKTKDENLRVFEAGQAFLKEKQDIPSDILALIIKHLILKMKEEYIFIKRQKLEVMEGLRQESLTIIGREEVRGTVNVKSPEPKLSPPPGKGKKGSEPVSSLPQPVEGKKYSTVLRERGEEWRDRIYVDDFPVDGPNLYIAVSGFKDPHLAVELIKIGIPLTAIVQIRIDETKNKIPSSLITTKRVQVDTETKTEKSVKFWEDLQDIRINTDTADMLKNTAFIIYSPPYWDSNPLTGNPEKVYDELSYLMYDVQDLSRQHLNYLDNMEIKHIVEDDRDERYYKYYFQYIDDIPLECVTVYSLLDSILTTACKEDINENSFLSINTEVTPRKQYEKKGTTDKSGAKVQTAKALVKSVFNSLCKIDADRKKYRTTFGEEYENHKDPIMIQYGDFVKNNTFHLTNINLDNIVGSALYGMPLHKLWLFQEPLDEATELKLSFHVNLLLSCFEREDVETAELCRLMHILACRKLYNNRSSLRRSYLNSNTLHDFKKVYLKRSIAEPLLKNLSLRENYSTRSPSFPSMTKSQSNQSYQSPEEEEEGENSDVFPVNSLFFCPDISELVSAAEIAINKPISHMIDEFEYFEDFSGICAYQILLDAFNKFNCVDYKYCEITDTIICMFFNSHDKDGIFREEWRVHMSTPLCLQDFFDFVLEEHYDWIQEQEKIYDAFMITKKQSIAQDIVDTLGVVSCIDDTIVETDLIMEGSLKYKEMMANEEARLLEANQDASDRDTTTTKSLPSGSTVNDSKMSRKNLSKPSTFISTPTLSQPPPPKPFLGYDISDRRVEVFGRDVAFFSRDRTRISCLYTLFIPYNVEYMVLNVVPGEEENEFWVHRALGDFIAPDVLERCEALRVNTKNQAMINIKKQLYQVPLPGTSKPFVKPISKIELHSSKSKDKKEKFRTSVHVEQVLPQFETKHYYSFSVTWPNGLITESVHDENSPDIAHIKQYHLEPLSHLDEDMRCISLNGEVVIFKTCGDIQVLCPDGRYIIITKYGKRVIPTGTPEFTFDTKNDGKSKLKDKSKGKEKGKNKKNPPEEEGPLKYELYINEFEIIEPNGSREKWVDDASYIIENLTITSATDYCIGEKFSKRTDGTNTLLNKDGLQIVTFPDRTRIVTTFEIEDEEIFPEWTEEEKEFFDMLDFLYGDTVKSKGSIQESYQSRSTVSSASNIIVEEEAFEKQRTDGYVSVQITFTVEHENFTTVSVNKANGKITVYSPNDTSVTVDTNNSYKLDLGDKTSAIFDGEDLNIIYEACPECKSYTKCDIKINKASTENTQQHWVKLKDSFCKKVVVDYEGNIGLLDEECSESFFMSGEENINPEENTEAQDDAKSDLKSESFVSTHGKCRDMYEAKNIKFIVMNRELHCSELVHRALLEQYKKECHWKPWCYMKQAETFGDHRSLHSVLTPIHVTETEKWLMNSKLCNKPSNLTYKDLKKDCGKSFYHWMRPYETFRPKPITPEPVHTHRLPRAFVLRTLEQQWPKTEQEELKGGKELLRAILRYRHYIESESETLLHVPIVDERLSFQRGVDRAAQALGKIIYQNLKERLDEDVQLRAKMTITTKPPSPPEEMSIEGEYEEEVIEAEKLLEEERAAEVNELDAAAAHTERLQRYWRRRAIERNIEQYYQFLLRQSTIPHYFENLLGGAIWSEIDHLADDAITSAQRKKMKCVCAAEAEAGTSNTNSCEPYM